MRAVATQLASLAADLDAAAGVAPVALPSLAFVGPGRAVHDEGFMAIAGDGTEAGQQLIQEARLLERDADRLEHEQRDWDRRKRAEDERRAREAREAQERARQQQRGGAR